MRIEDLLAVGMVPHIRVRYGPGIDETVSIDAGTFELRREELEEFCRGIPNIEQGLSWRTLMPYTGGNGTMAKVLIALGEIACLWKMHPPLRVPSLWNREHPAILAGSVALAAPVTSRVPKPSRGDLETSSSPCRCCRRPMGATSSTTHDLVDAGNGSCLDCAEADCEVGLECKVFGTAVIELEEKRAQVEEPVQAMPDDLFQAYVRQFE
jgi:hypothetical protein